MSPDLSDAEIDDICRGLVQNAAKVRYLRGLGVAVERKPNGRPLVHRAHYEAVRSGSARPPTSNGIGSSIRWSAA